MIQAGAVERRVALIHADEHDVVEVVRRVESQVRTRRRTTGRRRRGDVDPLVAQNAISLEPRRVAWRAM